MKKNASNRLPSYFNWDSKYWKNLKQLELPIHQEIKLIDAVHKMAPVLSAEEEDITFFAGRCACGRRVQTKIGNMPTCSSCMELKIGDRAGSIDEHQLNEIRERVDDYLAKIPKFNEAYGELTAGGLPARQRPHISKADRWRSIDDDPLNSDDARKLS